MNSGKHQAPQSTCQKNARTTCRQKLSIKIREELGCLTYFHKASEYNKAIKNLNFK